MPKKPLKSEIRTVMLVDLVGYTHRTSKLPRVAFANLHDIFDSIVEPTVEEFHGKIIKKLGDAFLVTFTSATDAVHTAIALQKRFYELNKANPKRIPLQIRVAMHSGEVLFRKGDIYGEAVNITARLEAIAKAKHILFSESVYNAMNKNEVPYIYLGKKRFKGLRRPLAIFRVKMRKEKYRKIKSSSAKGLAKFLFTILVLVTFLILAWVIAKQMF